MIVARDVGHLPVPVCALVHGVAFLYVYRCLRALLWLFFNCKHDLWYRDDISRDQSVIWMDGWIQ